VLAGAEKRERRAWERALATGWYAENFSRAGKSLKNLSDYLRPELEDRGSAALLGVLRSIQAKGKVPMQIERIERLH
jgi:hypothetical protein